METALHPAALGLPPDRQRVGPNAIIQTRRALDHSVGIGLRRSIFDRAGLQKWQLTEPADLVAADAVNALNSVLIDTLDKAESAAVLAEAGALTADYILANRIPGPAQLALKILPAQLALRLLLKAITRNAWTFAGSATVTSGADWRGQGWIAISNNPICTGKAGLDCCIWHEAVFKRLFATLVSPRVSVTETQCCGRGDPACHFAICLI